MLAAMLNRFRSRDAALSTVAQLALTWAANHLSGVITAQTDQIAFLEEQCARTERERDSALEVVDEQESEIATLKATIREVGLLGAVSPEQQDVVRQSVASWPAAAYPAADDLDPLGRADAPAADTTSANATTEA